MLGGVFASREAHRQSYLSQSQDRLPSAYVSAGYRAWKTAHCVQSGSVSPGAAFENAHHWQYMVLFTWLARRRLMITIDPSLAVPVITFPIRVTLVNVLLNFQVMDLTVIWLWTMSNATTVWSELLIENG
jgi:hypothetical protein